MPLLAEFDANGVAAEEEGFEFALPRPRSMVERAMDRGSRLLDPPPAEDSDEEALKKLPKLEPLVEYQNDPVRFMVEKLGIPEHTIKWSLNPGYDTAAFAEREWSQGDLKWKGWDGTPDPLVAMLEAVRDSLDVCIEAGTGTQKSHTAACVILWFLACFYEARAFTFAPKEEQLRAFIWMEIGKLWPRFQVIFPTAILTDLRIRMRGVRDTAWGAQGYAVGQTAGEEVSTKAQGMHAEHMLLVYEETPGIKYAVIEAGENTATAPHNIRMALGNPDYQLDALHLFGHDQFGVVRPGVKAIRISALDHPNLVSENPSIVPGAASEKSVRRRLLKYGAEGRLYKSRVRGISPSESVESLIKLEWIQRAQTRWSDEHDAKILQQGKLALGVDVANSEEGDEGAISRWKGAYCKEVVAFPCPNSNNLGYDVHIEMKDKLIDALNVGVDPVGVGAGCVNKLHEYDHYVVEISGGEDGDQYIEGQDGERFLNMRCQVYWTLREDLRLDRIALPPDVHLASELVVPKWKTHNGKIIVESKEDIKKRTPGGKSPNRADAVAYGNWVRDRSPVTSLVPKKHPTTAQRLQKELEDLDREGFEHHQPKSGDRFGRVLRQ